MNRARSANKGKGVASMPVSVSTCSSTTLHRMPEEGVVNSPLHGPDSPSAGVSPKGFDEEKKDFNPFMQPPPARTSTLQSMNNGDDAAEFIMKI